QVDLHVVAIQILAHFARDLNALLRGYHENLRLLVHCTDLTVAVVTVAAAPLTLTSRLNTGCRPSVSGTGSDMRMLRVSRSSSAAPKSARQAAIRSIGQVKPPCSLALP